MARSPNIDKAYELYKSGMKLVEIASQLGLSAATIRTWKNRYDWDSNKSETFQKKSETKRNVSESKTQIPEEINQVINNTELTDKQQLFCLYYSNSFNATKSYQKAYGVAYLSAMTLGSNMLRNVNVRAEITRLKEQRYSKALLTQEDIFQKYVDIAYADMSDYTTFGQKEIEYADKAGNEHTANVSYVDINESSEVDGTLISEVSQGKDGVRVKLADRMKALQWVADHMDLATEKQKAEIDLLKLKSKGSSNSSEEIFKNMETLAELIRKPVEDRNIDDLEGEPDE